MSSKIPGMPDTVARLLRSFSRGDRVRASMDYFSASVPALDWVREGELGTVVDVDRVPVAIVVWDREPDIRCPVPFDVIDPVLPG